MTRRLFFCATTILAMILISCTFCAAVETNQQNKQDTIVGHKALATTQAVILGVVEGLTEYLPVSSTGHLLLAE